MNPNVCITLFEAVGSSWVEVHRETVTGVLPNLSIRRYSPCDVLTLDQSAEQSRLHALAARLCKEYDADAFRITLAPEETEFTCTEDAPWA